MPELSPNLVLLPNRSSDSSAGEEIGKLIATTPTQNTFVNSVSKRDPSRILIIDDDLAVRRLVAGALAKHGFTVAAAADGAEGIMLAEQHSPDLIVCDLAMPGMDGFEVLAALRHQPALSDTPIIFLTGQAEPAQVRQGMNLGADDYLPKPVDLADLLGAVNARLSRRGIERQRQEQQLQRGMQLFTEVVHDLRDPLFVALGCTDLLKNGGPRDQPPGEVRPKEVLARMERAVGRMQTIIAETLFLAKSRMHRLPFDPTMLELRCFCEHLVEGHEQTRRLRFHCAGGDFPIFTDGLRLQQALDNLLSNALNYSEDLVNVSLSQHNGHYRIEVADKGIGIPADEQSSIFEPFFRASNTGGRAGHGLGLCVVKSCAEQQGGRLLFQSLASQGTSFWLELPPNLKSESKAPAEHDPARRFGPASSVASDSARFPAGSHGPHPAAAGPVPARRSRITGMLVDDDPLVRSVLRDMLEECAGDVTVVAEAASLAQARLVARQYNLDFVFLDLGLPDGSGFDLLPNLPTSAAVVFVTNAEEYAVHAFDCQATDYLLKPVNSARLHQAMERVRARLAARVGASLAEPEKVDGSVLIKTLTEKRLVAFREIRSIVAYGEYSRVYWDKDKAALLRKSLRQWEAELPSTQFVRVHRQAIVNLAFMQRIEKLVGGKLQVHVRDAAKPFAVSLRLAPMLNRKLKTFCGEQPAGA